MQTPAFAATKTVRTSKLFRGLIWVAAMMAACLCPSQAFGQTNSSWNGGTGNWSTSTDWTPNQVPNNGGGNTYDVTIGIANSNVTMDVLNDTINNLSLEATNSLTITDDTLSLVSGKSLDNGTILNNAGIFNNNLGSALTINSRFFNEGVEFPDSVDPATLNNAGKMFISAGAELVNQVVSTFNNSGRLTNAGTLLLLDEGTFNNLGTFTNISQTGLEFAILDSEFFNSGKFYNYGVTYGESSNITNNFGASIINHGSINFYGGINNYGKIANTVFGTITSFEGGYIANYGTLKNAGSLDNSGGELYNYGILNNSGTLLNNSVPDQFLVGTFENYGTINNSGTIDNSGVFNNEAGGTLTNHGLITSNGTVSNDGAITNIGKVINSGTFTNGDFLGGSGTFINVGTVTNSGQITVDYGTVVNNGTIMNSGGILVLLSSSFANNGTIVDVGSIDNHAVMSNGGTIYIKAGGSLDNSPGANDGFFVNGGKIIDAGNLSNAFVNEFDSPGTLIITATGQLTNAYIVNTNGLINSGTINNEGSIANDGTLTNNGTINNSEGTGGPGRNGQVSTATLINNSVINNVGENLNDNGLTVFADSIINRGTINDGGTIFNYTALDNQGTLNITPAGVFNGPNSGGTFLQTSGQTIVNGTLNSTATIQIQGGTLSGSGTINGNVVMGGKISPGNSPGILTINGNYTQTASGVYDAEIAGLTPGLGYDQLLISGTADLDGKLDVGFLDNFTVDLGDSFVLMKYTSETGTYSMVELPKLGPGLKWDLSYDPGYLDLSVAPSTVNPTPEPSTYVLWGTAGLLGIGMWARRKFRRELNP
jgi:hypothetical protein